MRRTASGGITPGPGVEKAMQTSAAFERLGDPAAHALGVRRGADLPLVRERRPLRREVGAALVQRAAAVADDHAARVEPAAREQAVDRHVGRSGADHGDADPGRLAPRGGQRVLEPGEQHDGGPLLVVVPDGDLELLERGEHAKAVGLADVLRIDAAEGRLEHAHRGDQLVRGAAAQAEGHGVDAAQVLEEERLALHHRQAGLGADVAEPEHTRAVGDDGDAVAERERVLRRPAGSREQGFHVGSCRHVGLRSAASRPPRLVIAWPARGGLAVAFEIRRADYYYAVIADTPERAGALLAELAGLGVNLLAFSAVPMGPVRTELTLFPEDGPAFEAAARRAGLAIDGPHGALLVQGDDELGALGRVHALLSQANVDVFASSGVADGRGGFGYVIYVPPEHLERAVSALGL
jgi:hypothetical protein